MFNKLIMNYFDFIQGSITSWHIARPVVTRAGMNGVVVLHKQSLIFMIPQNANKWLREQLDRAHKELQVRAIAIHRRNFVCDFLSEPAYDRRKDITSRKQLQWHQEVFLSQSS